MGDITEKQQKALLELGWTFHQIWINLKLEIISDKRQVIKMKYLQYKDLARKLGINLPAPPTEETTTDAEIETFILKQSKYVGECLTEKANLYNEILYNAGYEINNLSILLLFKSHPKVKADEVDVTQSVRNLQVMQNS